MKITQSYVVSGDLSSNISIMTVLSLSFLTNVRWYFFSKLGSFR